MAGILIDETIVGNVSSIYEKRVVGAKNTSVIDFNVVATPRKREGDEWVDGEPYWLSVTAWGKLADNIAESFRVGDRVFVKGRKEMKKGFTNNKGEEVPPRPVLIADFAGLEVGRHVANSTRPINNVKSNYSVSNAPQQQRTEPAQQSVTENDDIFSTDDDLDLSSNDEPPF